MRDYQELALKAVNDAYVINPNQSPSFFTRVAAHAVYEMLKNQIERLQAQVKRLENESALEIVICSAIRMPDGRIFRGHRHCHCIKVAHSVVMYAHEKFGGPAWECPYGDGQGFISSKNRYVTREEGMRLQLAAGIESVAEGGYRGSILFSEDLY